jgi:putative ABC transport system substrate-binding protein
MFFKKKFVIFFAGCVFLSLYLYNNTSTSKDVISIMQIVPHPSLDRIRTGIIDTLKKDNPSLEIAYQNAQGSMPLSVQIAQKFTNENSKMIIAIETPSTLNAYNVAKKHEIPVVFAAVSDPISAGFAESFNQPLRGLTGISDALDPCLQVQFIKKLFKDKDIQKIGTLYNASEPNSVSQIENFEAALKETSFILTKVSISASADITQAAGKLSQEVDLILIFNDNMVASSMPQVIKIAEENNVPVLTTDPESVGLGALAALAYDQYKIGVQTAKLALKVLKSQKNDVHPLQHADALAVYLNREKMNLFKIQDFEKNEDFSQIIFLGEIK